MRRTADGRAALVRFPHVAFRSRTFGPLAPDRAVLDSQLAGIKPKPMWAPVFAETDWGDFWGYPEGDDRLILLKNG